ncbi:hypothetical protein [Marinomonas ostreistagni]|uniref:Thiamine pyrophosphate-binding protein n=1 Tax=Marinomonas ostreistagni TaxID=359209 RepID=A0ABS0ZC20_9GAMM|nr:hypothetical protein [Marinomonas ostreistagni]MBJ7551218.1 hypothetical protein [Marinomonas ostreistagni]
MREVRQRSKGMNKSSLWFRWRFHLSGLLILIPIVLTPSYIELMSIFGGANGLGERTVGSRQVGPWTITLAEQFEAGPILDGPAGYMKTFNAALCQECAEDVKAVYIRLGKPRNLRTAGVIGFGSPYHMSFTMPVAENTSTEQLVWLTLEGWDGALHQTQWTLEEASPATVQFLKQLQE